MAAGGQVTLLGQQIEERLTPRQLRYLFAIGAVARGQGAGVAASQAGGREAKRMAIKQGMQTQRGLVTFQKGVALASLKQSPPFLRAAPAQRTVMLRTARQQARTSVKQFGTPFGTKRAGSITRPKMRSRQRTRELALKGAVRGAGMMAGAALRRLTFSLASSG